MVTHVTRKSMTPKEKALNLCQKFGMTTLFSEDCNNGYTLPLRVAKKCVLIAVEEILEAIDWHEYETPNKEIIYWQEVKQEIEKL